MKKFLALMVAMLMVFGIASFAAADVEVSGDARVRGISVDETDMNKDTDDAVRYYDQRIRLNVVGSNDDGAGVKLQWTAAENVWGLAVRDNGAGSNPASSYAVRYDDENYAYLYFPVVEGWTVSAGLMPADWGHKFWAWGVAKERLKISGKVNDISVGAFTEKGFETSNGEDQGGHNLKDVDGNAIYAIAPLGEFKVGAIYVMGKDNRPVLTAADCTDIDATYSLVGGNCETAGGDVAVWGGADGSGSKIDIFFSGQAGPVALMGEFAQNSGDIYESEQGDSPTGMFVGGGMDVGVKVSAAIAMTSNGYVANKYFTPTLMIGTSQPTAVANLGQGLDAGDCPTLTTCTDDTTAIVVGVSKAVTDAVTVGGRIMTATLKAYDEGAGAEDGSLSEIDLELTYALGEKTSYKLAVGQLSADIDTAGVDLEKVTAMMHQVSTSF